MSIENHDRIGRWVLCTPEFLRAGGKCLADPRRTTDDGVNHEHWVERRESNTKRHLRERIARQTRTIEWQRQELERLQGRGGVRQPYPNE